MTLWCASQNPLRNEELTPPAARKLPQLWRLPPLKKIASPRVPPLFRDSLRPRSGPTWGYKGPDAFPMEDNSEKPSWPPCDLGGGWGPYLRPTAPPAQPCFLPLLLSLFFHRCWSPNHSLINSLCLISRVCLWTFCFIDLLNSAPCILMFVVLRSRSLFAFLVVIIWLSKLISCVVNENIRTQKYSLMNEKWGPTQTSPFI